MIDGHHQRTLGIASGEQYRFHFVPLEFTGNQITDIFSFKNNKSLRETLIHRRYIKFLPTVLARYEGYLDFPLGEFLLHLKSVGDPFYLKFLNKNGDQHYTIFKIVDKTILSATGVYAYFLEDELRYIGRCKDSMKKRVNQGYGKIHPKNCYIDGQSTNCHLNAKIYKVWDKISLWLYQTTSIEEIILLERQLINEYQPLWNIQKY